MKAAAGGALLGLLPACAPEKGTGQPEGRFAPAGASVEIDGEGALLVVGGATSTAADGPLREAWSFAPADGRCRFWQQASLQVGTGTAAGGRR